MKSSDLKKQQTCLFKDDSFAEIGRALHGSNGSPLGRAAISREWLYKDDGFRLRVHAEQSANSDNTCHKGGQAAAICPGFNQLLILLTQHSSLNTIGRLTPNFHLKCLRQAVYLERPKVHTKAYWTEL